jgi:glycosyltransferase involved in cell wall biosynthesis
MQFANKNYLEKNGIRFIEGMLHEDNYYTPIAMWKASRVKYLSMPYYHRRVRPNSLEQGEHTIKNIEGLMAARVLLHKYLENNTAGEEAFIDSAKIFINSLDLSIRNKMRSSEIENAIAFKYLLQIMNMNDERLAQKNNEINAKDMIINRIKQNTAYGHQEMMNLLNENKGLLKRIAEADKSLKCDNSKPISNDRKTVRPQVNQIDTDPIFEYQLYLAKRKLILKNEIGIDLMSKPAKERAICFAAAGAQTASPFAYLSAGRLAQIDKLENEQLFWIQFRNYPKDSQREDAAYWSFFASNFIRSNYYVSYKYVEDPQRFAKAALHWALPFEANVVFSAPFSVSSHAAAIEYKKIYPSTKWYAEIGWHVMSAITEDDQANCGIIDRLVMTETYKSADVLIFSSGNQYESTLSYESDSGLIDIIRKKAIILSQPSINDNYIYTTQVSYGVDRQAINIAYFGDFSERIRNEREIIMFIDNPNVRLHLFLDKNNWNMELDDIKSALQDKYQLSDEQSRYIYVRPLPNYFEMLNIASKMDYLLLEYAQSHLESSPYFTAMYANYHKISRTSGTKIIVLMQGGDTLDEEDSSHVMKVIGSADSIINGLTKQKKELDKDEGREQGFLDGITEGIKTLESGTLLITNTYPSIGNPYANGFVHSRVKAYKKRGKDIDVITLNRNNGMGYENGEQYEYEGITVTPATTQQIAGYITVCKPEVIAVHFLSPGIWNAIKPFLDTGSFVLRVWVHGFEIDSFELREPFYDYSHKLEYKANTDNTRAMWADVFHAMQSYDIRLSFVSRAFAERALLGRQNSWAGVMPQHTITHNAIDTDTFNYVEKPSEQRKKILTIRPFASGIYAPDIIRDTIVILSKTKEFSDLEFLIVGQGEKWREYTNPLSRYTNVTLRNEFVSHEQISVLHKEYGIFLTPTRLDSQGVSRDEAMSSGLVPVTSAIDCVKEFVTDGEDGIICPVEDVQSYANAILDLYHHPDKFLEISKNAANRVRRQSASDIIIPKEIEFLESKRHDDKPGQVRKQNAVGRGN